jgi:Fe-S-cluster containining protein
MIRAFMVRRYYDGCMGDAALFALCQACGLCCDGSLFGRVDLEPGEVDRARALRLRVIGSGRSFEQPCSALGEGTPDGRRSCSIYEERPAACRRFECRLHEKLGREGGSLDEPLAIVRRARSLLGSVRAPGAEQVREELARILEENFSRATRRGA